MELSELRKLVRNGEGQELEFKRKATHPNRIAREIIAFANTDGGKLLVGVDDDQTIYGCKYADEEAYAITSFMELYCKPRIRFTLDKISITPKREVLVFDIQESRRKPHFLLYENQKQTFVRVEDMSITASREMITVLRNSHRQNGVSIRFGEREKTLFQYLEEFENITLAETQKLLKTTRRSAAGLLVVLVRAGLLSIHPTEKGDYFRLSSEAFES
jgi:predicted HTH transcriptional regulator